MGLLALSSWHNWWPYVGAWLGTQTPLSLGGWLLAASVGLALTAYLTLRRAAP